MCLGTVSVSNVSLCAYIIPHPDLHICQSVCFHMCVSPSAAVYMSVSVCVCVCVWD